MDLPCSAIIPSCQSEGKTLFPIKRAIIEKLVPNPEAEK
jgi:hypothetical protein